MARACACCSSPRRAEIDLALQTQSQRAVAAAFGISKSAVERHSRHAGHPVTSREAFPEAYFATGCTNGGADPAPFPVPPTFRQRVRPASPLILAEKRRRALQSRECGRDDDEIALSLGVPQSTVTGWFREADDRARRTLTAQTATDIVSVLHHRYEGVFAGLQRAMIIATAKGDTRTMIEISRELRLALGAATDFAERRGTFNTPSVAADAIAHDDARDVISMMTGLAKNVFTEPDPEALDIIANMLNGSDTLTRDPDGDDDPPQIHVTT